MEQAQDRQSQATGYPMGHPGDSPGYGQEYGSGTASHPWLSIQWLVRFVRRHGTLLLLASTLGATAAFVRLQFVTPIYEATAAVEIAVRRPRIMDMRDAVLERDAPWSYDEKVNTHLLKLRGTESRQAVLKALRASGEFPMNTQFPSATFKRQKQSYAVLVVCRHPDPAIAAATANAYATYAERQSFDETREKSNTAVQWLQNRAQAQKEEMARLDMELAALTETNRVHDIESHMTATRSSLERLMVQLAELRGKRVLAEKAAQVLESLAAKGGNLGSVPEGVPMADELEASLHSLRAAKAEQERLAYRYKAKHPAMIAAHQAVDLEQRKLEELLSHANASATAGLALIDEQLSGVRNEAETHRKVVTQLEVMLTTAQNRLAALERERQAADTTYRGILDRIEEARLSADENTTSVTAVTTAAPPSRPVYPVPTHVYALFIALCFFGAAGLATLADHLADQISSSHDLEQDLHLRVLSVVPTMPSAQRGPLIFSCLTSASPLLQETFAGLRTILNSPRYRDLVQTLVIASTAPEEGKTTIACCLAGALAHSGRRVLLIDLDMRNPRLARVFNIQDKARSLAHALSVEAPLQETDLAKLANPVAEVPGLDVVVSFHDNALHAAEIIAGPQMSAFLRWARATYDNVVIDTPPIGLLSDASAIAAMATGTVLVTRADHTRKKSLQHAIRLLQDADTPILGAVVNRVKLGMRSSFGNAYYNRDYYHPHYHKQTAGK